MRQHFSQHQWMHEMFQVTEAPSAWMAEIDIASPRLPDVIVIASRDNAPNEIEAQRLADLEKQFGPAKCVVTVPGYEGPNATYRWLFGSDLTRDCVYRLQLTPQDERPGDLARSSGYLQPLD